MSMERSRRARFANHAPSAGEFAIGFLFAGVFVFLITPLVFLGGVFYSIHMLPDFWRGLSLFNPIFYMVNGLRYGVLGVADASPWLSFLISVGLAAVLFGWTVHLFKVGYRLKS